MKRREFFIKGSLGTIGLAFLPQILAAKESETNLKIQFIESLVDYGTQHLELILKEDFYTTWSEEEEPHYYLYVSSTVKIESPKGVSNYLYFAKDKATAVATQKKYIDSGHHTLLYVRDGKQEPKLSNSLLSYSKAAIAFNIYHEAAHQHFKKHAKISHKLEEAACDVMAVFGAKFYAERNDLLKLKEVEKQNAVVEKAYVEINKLADLVTDDAAQNVILFQKLEKKLFKMFAKSDQFFKNRFMHPVNNAYLIMMRSYCEHYLLMKEVAIKDKFINTFLYTIENLPKNEKKAIAALKLKLGKEVETPALSPELTDSLPAIPDTTIIIPQD